MKDVINSKAGEVLSLLGAEIVPCGVVHAYTTAELLMALYLIVKSQEECTLSRIMRMNKANIWAELKYRMGANCV